jgi:hypothetical protein
VKDIQGDTLTLSTAQNVTTVHLTQSTQIEKYISGTPADLQTGQRIMVIGQRDAKGNIIAERITILNNNPAPRPFPTPTGTEP